MKKPKKIKEGVEYIKEPEVSGIPLAKSIKKIRAKLKKCQEEKQDYLSGWQRAKADFINFKKEKEEELLNLRKWTSESLIEEILPILDNFYRAQTHLPQNLEETDWVKGIFQIKNQLEEFLKNQGVEEIKTEEIFNPELHEAIERVKSEKKEGTILEVLQKGYKLNGRVIRPAKVKVAK